MSPLTGRHALVTGGGSGIGAAIAVALAAAGARVTVAGRRQEGLEETAGRHGSIAWAVGDVTDPESVAALHARAIAQSGPVDIVVANAGAGISTPYAKMTAADWDLMLKVNLTGVHHVWQATVQPMAERGWGRLIAVASTAGLKGYPYVTGYCAAKHGVVGLTRALAQEMAKTGVTVNAVCPGFTETPMLERTLENIVAKTGRTREAAAAALKSSNPQGRFIHPEEVAQAVLWLCGPGSESVTGQAIPISGGEV